jgi:hypothetical protein
MMIFCYLGNGGTPVRHFTHQLQSAQAQQAPKLPPREPPPPPPSSSSFNENKLKPGQQSPMSSSSTG